MARVYAVNTWACKKWGHISYGRGDGYCPICAEKKYPIGLLPVKRDTKNVFKLKEMQRRVKLGRLV